MPDILISYSRRDKDFVSRLHHALAAQNFDIWVDWEDIPITADWWREIREGIEGSDSFIFVLSPASLASPVCAMEIAYAIDCNKQFIPIVYETVNVDDVITTVSNYPVDPIVANIMQGQNHIELINSNWQKVGRHNWLFFNQESLFDDSVSRLIQAIRTDLSHVRTHTRLLLRAKEWDYNHRQASYLLSGTGIAEAERWLADSGSKEPKPSQLHTEYLLASRARQRQQMRRLLMLVSTGMLLVGLLAILSFFLYQQSEANFQIAAEERDRANQEARIALSGRTAIQSLMELNQQNTDTAFLLSLAAFNIFDSRETRSSILTALQRVPQLTKILYDHQMPVRAIASAPDGVTYATGDSDGTILVWQEDVIQHRLQAPSDVWDLAYSPEGDFLVASGGDGIIYRWDTTNYQPLAELAAGDTTLYSLDVYDQQIAAGYDDGMIRLWDIQSGELLQTLEGHQDYVLKVSFSPDGTQLASGSADQQIFLWDLTGDSPSYRELSGHTNWVWALDFSPDGRTLASGSADATLRLWDVESVTPKGQPLTDHRGWVRAVQFSPDGQQLASASGDRTIILRDAQTGRRITQIAPFTGHADEVFDIAYYSEGQLVSVGEDNRIMTWAIASQIPLNTDILETGDWFYQLAISPDEQTLLGAGDGGTLLWRDQTSGEMIPQEAEAVQIMAVAWHPSNGQYGYVTANGKVVLGSGQNREVIVPENGVPLRAIAFSPDGAQLAFAGDDQRIQMWDIEAQTLSEKILEEHRNRVSSLVFTTDSLRLISGDFGGELIVWDMESGDVLTTLSDVHQNAISRLKLSHNGHWLASASRDRTVVIWNTQNWEALEPRLEGHTDWVLDVTFNADDTMLVTGGRDRRVMLWDVATMQSIGEPLHGHDGWVWSVVFDPSSDQLISSSDDNTLRFWDLRIETWQKLACNIVNRSLTELEWRRYLPTLEYQAQCSQ